MANKPLPWGGVGERQGPDTGAGVSPPRAPSPRREGEIDARALGSIIRPALTVAGLVQMPARGTG